MEQLIRFRINNDSDVTFRWNTPRTDVAKLCKGHIAALLFKEGGM